MERKRRTGIRMLSLAAALLLAAVFSGCSPKPSAPAELPASSATPPPAEAQNDATLSVQLYFPSADGRALSGETRTVPWPKNTSRALCALRALCDGPQSDQLKAAVPEGWSIQDAELSGDVCEVYFSGSAASDEELLIARAAVAATVGANEEIGNIDLFLNGMQPGYNGRPLGVLQPIDEPLDVYLKEYAPQASTGEAEGFENISVQLFFADSAGALLLSDVRAFSYKTQVTGDIVIIGLLGELFKGPVESNGREPVLPSDMQLTKCALLPKATDSSLSVPLAADTSNGSLVELHFTKPAGDFNEALAYASIVDTVTSFWPNTEGVRIYLDDQPVLVDDVLKNGEEGSVFLRSDFKGMLGHTATLLFPDQDGVGLYPVLRSMPQNEVYDPLARLRALFTGPADPGTPLSIFSAEDVRSVAIEGDTAVVSWKAGFYQKLLDFVSAGESTLPQNTRAQMAVFSIVDTLASMPGVERVWMLEEGARIDKSVSLLYLGNALFYNPGLLLTGEDTSPQDGLG